MILRKSGFLALNLRELCIGLSGHYPKARALHTTKFGIVQYEDQMMTLFLCVFTYRNAIVHVEVMLAIGALACSIDVDLGSI
jgi:hypothetical protein